MSDEEMEGERSWLKDRWAGDPARGFAPRAHEMLWGCADYGFEYSSEDEQEQDVDIENHYYNSKGSERSLMIRKASGSLQTCLGQTGS